MREVTLCFPVRSVAGDDGPSQEVLLGVKRRGFGVGKVTGLGGRLEAGESAAAAAVRELAEESGLLCQAADLRACGVVEFYFPAKPAWDQRAYLFLTNRWQGELCECEEIKPVWFQVEAIPYAAMWADSVHWLPQVLNGASIWAVFTFEDDNESLKKSNVEILAA